MDEEEGCLAVILFVVVLLVLLSIFGPVSCGNNEAKPVPAATATAAPPPVVSEQQKKINEATAKALEFNTLVCIDNVEYFTNVNYGVLTPHHVRNQQQGVHVQSCDTSTPSRPTAATPSPVVEKEIRR